MSPATDPAAVRSAQPGGHAAASGERSRDGGRPPLVLLVEDDPKVAGFIEQGLREEGFEVEVARDGEHAIALAQGGSPAVIILDLMLPKRSGLEVVVELRRTGRTTPILLLSARDAPADIERVQAAGANDFMAKPFRFNDLLARVRALIPSGTG